MTSATTAPLLDAGHAAFIQSGLAIDLASHEPGLVPVVARAVACRVSPDRRRVTVFLDGSRHQRFLDAVAASRVIAAVFCHPSTLETIQLKGTDAAVTPVEASDEVVVAGTVDAFVATIMGLGFASAIARHELRVAPGGLAAVAFTVGAAFVQTPGPAAGSRI